MPTHTSGVVSSQMDRRNAISAVIRALLFKILDRMARGTSSRAAACVTAFLLEFSPEAIRLDAPACAFCSCLS